MPPFNDSDHSEKAFEEFFKEHFKSACSYCQHRYSFDIETSKEIVHTAFIKLWQNREHIQPGQLVQPYLYKIIANATIDYLKHQRVKQKHQDFILKNYSESDPGSVVNTTDFKQLTADIDLAVSKLPQMMRRIFEMSRFEGLKYREIASLLGISVKTVETQMSRALVKLKKDLARYLTVLLIVSSAVTNIFYFLL